MVVCYTYPYFVLLDYTQHNKNKEKARMDIVTVIIITVGIVLLVIDLVKNKESKE